MATVSELLVAVFVTASLVLVTAILIGRYHGQPLKPSKTENPTPRIDDIPADHTDNLDRNPKPIVEQDPVLRRDAALARKHKKSLTLRIDDIPADQTDNLDRNLKSILEEVPDLSGDADTMVRRSLVPYGKDSLCATISIITSLSADHLSAQLRRAGNGHPYNYTCKFEGITPLCEDKNGADVDIIAVPGLGSHTLGSWKSPNSDDVWLRDFLPKDVPNIRVLLYGYDTTLPGSLSKQSIEDLGGALLEQIIAYRASDGTSHRPIIFTGHSLGGLLIKEALVRARRRRSNANSDLSKASYGLLFFGVPNLGLRNDQLRTLVRGQPNEALIHDLLVDSDSEPSTFLRRLADQFSESCKGHYRVVTFFERSLSPTLELDQHGKWCKTGRPSLLVTEKSTTSTGLVTVAEEDNIALNTDHSGLVKYDSRSQGDYTIVRERLRRLVDEARLEVAKRFAEHNLYQPQSETTEACLRSLAFDDMDGRPNEINDAADGTCKWLRKHETFIQWTRQHRGLLWIKGKPGSGKSTLLKYALQEVPALYGTDTLSFSFFFHRRGHELQRTPLGLFRSLLHQLLSTLPGALPDLIGNFEHKRKTVGEPGEKWQWHLQPLQTFLKSSLRRILKRFPVILFIDALDECDEQSARELIRQLSDLLSSLPSSDSRFGICFSCRQSPILHLDDGLTIQLDTENSDDIATVIEARLPTSHLDVDVGKLIINGAGGVFTWARLILERVLELRGAGGSRAEIEVVVELLFETGRVDVNMRDKNGWMPLSWAAEKGYEAVVKLLLDTSRVDIDVRDKNGRTPLSLAAEKGREAVVELLLDTGKVDVDARDKTGRTPLSWAAEEGHEVVVKLLLDTGKVDINAGDRDGCTPLSWAAEKGFEAMVRLLLGTSGVNVDSRDKNGRTPLSLAALSRNEAVVKLLLDTGIVDVNARDKNDRGPLLLAAESGHEAVAKLLLDTGKVDVDAIDEDGWTPLSLAARNGREAVVELLKMYEV